jgi:hypothetical protein
MASAEYLKTCNGGVLAYPAGNSPISFKFDRNLKLIRFNFFAKLVFFLSDHYTARPPTSQK